MLIRNSKCPCCIRVGFQSFRTDSEKFQQFIHNLSTERSIILNFFHTKYPVANLKLQKKNIQGFLNQIVKNQQINLLSMWKKIVLKEYVRP